MKLEQSSLRGIKFFYRPAFSDLKTFEEVIGRTTYLKRGLKIEKGERWMDCGGNVGAFALLACKLGATVNIYEPDPFNCEMIERNLKLNNFSSQAKIIQAALVHNQTKETTLFIGNNNAVWRNSIVKKWNNKGLKVPCLNFDKEAQGLDNCKMDIEGAEMPILENAKKVFNKLVYEWSFDIDPSLERLWAVIDKQKRNYRVEAAWSTICYTDKREVTWQKSWFPACTNVFCFRK